MKKLRIIVLFLCLLPVIIGFSQSSLKFSQDSVQIFVPDSIVNSDTTANTPIHRYQQTISDKEVWKSVGVTQLYNLTMSSILLAMPEEVSKWPAETKLYWPRIKNQYINSFTKPPVFDNDLFFINYIGHPYQGAFYYNSLRSKGATIAQSALFNFSQILLWEYVWEGGMEQPSIQDLITTPILGSVLGELAHRATIELRKKGFFWYEKVLVTVINPSYVINNGYK